MSERKMGLMCVALKVMVSANQIAILCFVDLLYYFDVLLTVQLSIFISVINQLDAQKFFSQ